MFDVRDESQTRSSSVRSGPDDDRILDQPRVPRIEGFTIKVLNRYHVVVGGYPRYDRDLPFDSTNPPGNIRQPAWGFPKNGTWYARSQKSRAYGEYSRDLCLEHGIEVLTNWWTPDDIRPDEIFEVAYLNTPLNGLRYARMFGITAGRGIVDEAIVDHNINLVKDRIRLWAREARNRGRYAHVADAMGDLRPLFMVWETTNFLTFGGKIQAGRVNKLIALMDWVHAEVQRETGLCPFIALSQHVAVFGDPIPRRDDLIESVDGIWLHQACVPELNQVVTARQSIAETQRKLIAPTVQRIAGLRSSATCLPIVFISGSMPQFDRDKVPGNNHGRIVAKAGDPDGAGGARAMFELVRNQSRVVHFEPAPPGSGHDLVVNRWVSLTSLDEWPEGHTLIPSTERPGKVLQPPYSDYGDLFLKAQKAVFADRVRTLRVGLDEQPAYELSQLGHKKLLMAHWRKTSTAGPQFDARFYADGSIVSFAKESSQVIDRLRIEGFPAADHVDIYSYERETVKRWKFWFEGGGKRLFLRRGTYTQRFERTGTEKPRRVAASGLVFRWRKVWDSSSDPFLFDLQFDVDGCFVVYREDPYREIEVGEVRQLMYLPPRLRTFSLTRGVEQVWQYWFSNKGSMLHLKLHTGFEQRFQRVVPRPLANPPAPPWST